MDPLMLAAWSLPVLLLLIFLRVPIGLSMLLMGLGGSWWIFGSLSPLLSQMQTLAYGQFSNHSLSIIPLFLLMGQLASQGGMSRALFKAAEAFIGHRKGGTAMAAVGACAGFGAICGSSLATAATMGQVALPELRRAGYANSISVGALAAGGTLGILIPPSIVLVICHINGPTVHDEAQMPFGGVKESGFGRFGGRAGIDAFTELRWMSMQTTKRHYPF
ncbi:aldehyde dehydrogenase family protein [Allofranklinella schreckenbergeri]|uniref:Aldehyde dehydrogenase family protein n=1 Tax=Allofranklinella schreckenbergeri TaxID=1076744 RepID=A0A3M6QSY6_9BURK|nr:aldehyde dehydrogenase family protein [Allofranklinella schreckenbergeri]RMX06130.1 aldehyde dehydrogenase family protein [Allofranklinella schreckenbergeri]